MSNKIELVNVQDEQQIHISVEVDEEGDLLFSGQDLGSTVRELFGDSDYEYWLSIQAEEKDRVLLALIEKLYSGNTSVISEFKEFLESKDIPSRFHSNS